MRARFWVCHSSTCPCIFHNFHTSSICQRTRSKTKASVRLSKSAGTLLMTSVHVALALGDVGAMFARVLVLHSMAALDLRLTGTPREQPTRHLFARSHDDRILL